MNRLFCIYLPVFILTLILAVSGLQVTTSAPEPACLSFAEQLSEPEPAANIECCSGFLIHLGADEGLTTHHGRRFGLNKPSKSNVYFRNNERDGKERSFKLLFTGCEHLYTRFLTSRHAHGFYIYSLKELLL